MPRTARALPNLSVEHQLQLNDLHNEIRIIKENHLHHMAQDIDNLAVEIADVKETVEKRFDKLDGRLWLLVGTTVTTLIGAVGAVLGQMLL
jgi:hypothetical protein